MASIPSNKQGQRLSGGAPVQAVSASNSPEALEGRALQGFANQVGNFGSGLARYQQARRSVDASIIRGAVQARGEYEANAAVYETMKNPGKKDGSELRQRFSLNYGQRLGFLDNIQDPEQRAIALNEAKKIEARYSGRMADEAIEQHAASIVSSVDDANGFAILAVQENPAKLSEMIQKMDQMIEGTGLLSTQQQKMKDATRKDLVFGAIQGFTKQGDFEMARETLKDPDVVRVLGGSGMREVTKKLDDEEEAFLDSKFKEETRAHILLTRQRKEVARRNSIKYLSTLAGAKTSEEFTQAENELREMAQAEIIEPSDFTSLKRASNFVEDDISKNTKGRIMEKILRDFPDNEVKSEIMSSLGQTLSSDDANDLLSEIDQKNKKELNNADYKRQKRAAKGYVKGVMDSVYAINIMNEKEYQLAAVQKRIYELEKQGYSPMKSAQLALGDVVREAATIVIPGIPFGSQNSIDGLRNEGQKIAQMDKQQGNRLSSVQKDRYKRMLQLIKRKSAALSMQQEINNAMRLETQTQKQVEDGR